MELWTVEMDRGCFMVVHWTRSPSLSSYLSASPLSKGRALERVSKMAQDPVPWLVMLERGWWWQCSEAWSDYHDYLTNWPHTNVDLRSWPHCNILVVSLKAGSQYDVRAHALHRACVTWNFHKFAVFGDQSQEHNAEEYKDRIRVYPCVSLCCIAVSTNTSVMQHNTGPYVVLWTGLNSLKVSQLQQWLL